MFIWISQSSITLHSSYRFKTPESCLQDRLCSLVAAALGVLVVRHGAVLGIAVELAVAVLVVDEGRVEEEGEEDDAIMVEKEARLVT